MASPICQWLLDPLRVQPLLLPDPLKLFGGITAAQVVLRLQGIVFISEASPLPEIPGLPVSKLSRVRLVSHIHTNVGRSCLPLRVVPEVGGLGYQTSVMTCFSTCSQTLGPSWLDSTQSRAVSAGNDP